MGNTRAERLFVDYLRFAFCGHSDHLLSLTALRRKPVPVPSPGYWKGWIAPQRGVWGLPGTGTWAPHCTQLPPLRANC